MLLQVNPDKPCCLLRARFRMAAQFGGRVAR